MLASCHPSVLLIMNDIHTHAQNGKCGFHAIVKKVLSLECVNSDLHKNNYSYNGLVTRLPSSN